MKSQFQFLLLKAILELEFNFAMKMKMKPCQFKHFHKYLTNLSKKIDDSTDNVDLLLVRDNHI